jgi:pectinesterase
MLSLFHLILALTATAAAAPASLAPRAGRPSAPSGCLSVGGSGKYKTVQSAVDALSTTSTTAQCIFIAKGTYKEQVLIDGLKSALTIYGETTDTSSFSANTVTITQGKSQDNSPTNDQTATLRAHTSNFKVYNINLVNTRGQGSQALALSANNGKQGYYGCQFKGFQDTILAETGVQIYAKSYIEGATDFIFGQKGQAWFDGVDIRVLAASLGYITANGRDSSSNPSYYVINKSKISAANGNNVPAGAYYLGRPWRNYARVVFQSTSMTNVINGAGWTKWNTGDDRTDNVLFGEFGNSGDGSKGSRASFSKKLSSAVSISTVLGSDYTTWVDTSYLS